jgi:NAD(P)H-hydrate epimerase
MGGCTSYLGAAKLSSLALAALRGGAGVARLALPHSLCHAILPHVLEVTLSPMPDEDGTLIYDESTLSSILAGAKALGVGIGWDHAPVYAHIISYLIRNSEIPLIIDAGGLNALSTCIEVLKEKRCPVILTPHPKEFSRLAKDEDMTPQAFAKKYGVILLLKGSATCVTDGTTTYEVQEGCAGMATAGSGDVLTGILTGMLGYLSPSVETIAAGATLAGIAGEIAQEQHTDIAMTAADTVAAIPQAIRKIRTNQFE